LPLGQSENEAVLAAVAGAPGARRAIVAAAATMRARVGRMNEDSAFLIMCFS
jgi:hypothetical protein